MPAPLTLAPSRSLRPLTLLAFLLAACGDDGNGPAPVVQLPVDAATLAAKAAQLRGVTEQPLLVALRDEFMLARVASVRGTPDAVGARALRIVGARSPAPATRLEPLVPSSLLGRTLRRGPFGDWIVDTLPNGTPRGGAPADGMRFIVPEPNGTSGASVGTLDVTNIAGPSTATSYRVRAVTTAGATAADYMSRQSFTAVSLSIIAIGTMARGPESIAIDDAVGIARITSAVQAPFADVRSTQVITGDFFSGGNLTLTATLVVRGEEMRVLVAAAGDSGRVRVFAGDRLFAQVALSETTGDPTDVRAWRRPDGVTPLDGPAQASLQALLTLFVAVPDLSQLDATVQDWVSSAQSGSGGPFARGMERTR